MQCCISHLCSAESPQDSEVGVCVCVCVCTVHLTSLNTNNVFPYINNVMDQRALLSIHQVSATLLPLLSLHLLLLLIFHCCCATTEDPPRPLPTHPILDLLIDSLYRLLLLLLFLSFLSFFFFFITTCLLPQLHITGSCLKGTIYPANHESCLTS